MEIDEEPTLIDFTWSALSSEATGGIPITGYKLEIQTQNGNFNESTYCNATSEIILSTLSCKVPMVSLLEIPFNLRNQIAKMADFQFLLAATTRPTHNLHPRKNQIY